jgi:hypothetical protein
MISRHWASKSGRSRIRPRKTLPLQIELRRGIEMERRPALGVHVLVGDRLRQQRDNSYRASARWPGPPGRPRWANCGWVFRNSSNAGSVPAEVM